MRFDPKHHRMVPLRGFDELSVGEVFALPSRTIGDANFAAFQTVSLDNHPIHYDVEYCKRLGYPAPLAHGLQVLSFTWMRWDWRARSCWATPSAARRRCASRRSIRHGCGPWCCATPEGWQRRRRSRGF